MHYRGGTGGRKPIENVSEAILELLVQFSGNWKQHFFLFMRFGLIGFNIQMYFKHQYILLLIFTTIFLTFFVILPKIFFWETFFEKYFCEKHFLKNIFLRNIYWKMFFVHTGCPISLSKLCFFIFSASRAHAEALLGIFE